MRNDLQPWQRAILEKGVERTVDGHFVSRRLVMRLPRHPEALRRWWHAFIRWLDRDEPDGGKAW